MSKTYTEEQFQAFLDKHLEMVERLVVEKSKLRNHNQLLTSAVKRLLDASWNGPVDADNPARIKAVNALLDGSSLNYVY